MHIAFLALAVFAAFMAAQSLMAYVNDKDAQQRGQ
jgi:hypothetical protein